MTKFITNQNIEIKLELAGLGDRILAFLIDAFIMLIYLLTILFFISVVANVEFSVTLFILLLPLAFYSLLFEIFTNGQSPGKKVRDIKVVKLDGGSPGLPNYLLRWVLRPIDILLYGSVAVVSIIATKHGQRLGDLAAGTTVIKQKAAVHLTDVGSINKDTEHSVTYPQVKRLTDKQVEVIRRTLQMRRAGLNGMATEEVAEKTKLFLNIENNIQPLPFLYTILKDYEQVHQ